MTTGTSPATFTDGISVYLDGFFTNFSLTFNDLTQSGSFTGNLTFTGGDVFPLLSATSGWTFGANLAGVSPTGYDLQLNGDVFLAVVSVEDETWGEAVAAAVVAWEGEALDLSGLQSWASERLSRYKLPRRLKVVPDLPRNSMGKVVKPAVRDLFKSMP